MQSDNNQVKTNVNNILLSFPRKKSTKLELLQQDYPLFV